MQFKAPFPTICKSLKADSGESSVNGIKNFRTQNAAPRGAIIILNFNSLRRLRHFSAVQK